MAVIIVVEDEAGIAEILTAVLESEGHEVVTACDGQAGLACIGQRRPDLVITDTMMPVMDGPTMVGKMIADPALADVPVVVMSAIPTAAAAYPCGTAFLRKPFRVGEVVSLAQRVLSDGRSPSRAPPS